MLYRHTYLQAPEGLGDPDIHVKILILLVARRSFEICDPRGFRSMSFIIAYNLYCL